MLIYMNGSPITELYKNGYSFLYVEGIYEWGLQVLGATLYPILL